MDYHRVKKTYTYLSYAGTLPFIMCALCLCINVHSIPVLGHVANILSIYSLIITAFMAGSHWGQHLSLNNEWAWYLPISSNICAILLWLLYLLLSFKMLIMVFVASFLYLLFIDGRMFYDRVITRDYFRVRTVVTIIVIVMLLISGIYS